MSHPDLKVGKATDDAPEWDQPKLAGVIPKVCFRWIFSGPSKSGKTNLARFVLDKFYRSKSNPNKSFFNRIILLSPTADIDWTWRNLDGLAKRDRITSPTPGFLMQLFNEQKSKMKLPRGGSGSKKRKLNTVSTQKHRKRKGTVLLILDDAICESALINSPEFMKVFIAGRHYGICTMMMTQSYVKIPRSARIQATHVSMFPSRTSEIERLWAEHGPRQLSKKEFINLVEDATRPTEAEPYPFLYVDAFEKPQIRFRRNFDTVFKINKE